MILLMYYLIERELEAVDTPVTERGKSNSENAIVNVNANTYGHWRCIASISNNRLLGGKRDVLK
jgi:hypothetical protein